MYEFGTKEVKTEQQQGRFPANIIIDEEAGKMLDEQTGKLKSGDCPDGFKGKFKADVYGKYKNNLINKETIYADKGGASRFFYCAKASKSERNLGCEELKTKDSNYREEYRPTAKESGDKGQETPYAGVNRSGNVKNNHPTVKPIKLMEYLIKLVSREGATILDPFGGSGTTAIACVKLNRKYILIEKEAEYIKIAEARLKPYLEQNKLGDY